MLRQAVNYVPQLREKSNPDQRPLSAASLSAVAVGPGQALEEGLLDAGGSARVVAY